MFKLKFGFYTDGLPFDGSPIEDRSLGGSESALWSMARELQRRGHDVDVFTKCPQPGEYNGVRYHSNERFHRDGLFGEWDVFVAHRFIHAQDFAARSKMVWAWLHDMPAGELRLTFAPHLWRVEQAIFLSEFHKAEYVKKLPELAGLAWLSRNGVDLGLVERSTAGAERRKNLLVYASRPERGLARLLVEVWPKLKEKRPDLELAICGYDMKGWDFPEDLRRLYANLEAMIESTPGVYSAGNLAKKDFYRLLASATALVYPTSFPEISCIAAIEAMACGAPVVTTADFALTETVPYAGVPGHVERDYSERFAARTLEVLDSGLLWKRLQKEGKDHVRNRYSWAQIAREWEERAYLMFRARARDTRKIFDQLVYESDLVAAREIAELHGLEAEHAWVDRILTTHHEEPDAYSEGAGEQVNAGWNVNPRFARIAALVPPGKQRVLDVGCGAGGLLAHLYKTRPELSLHGIDFSRKLIERARDFMIATFGGSPVELFAGDAATYAGEAYDVVISSEVLEHQVDTRPFVETLERACKKGGRIILTVPSGPWEAISFAKPAAEAKNDWEANRFHVHHFTARDLVELFGRKKDFHLQYAHAGYSDRGEMIGWFFVSWTAGKEPTGKVDVERKRLTTRPYQKIAYCMIVKNEEDGLLRNLRSILPVVDEIHISDTGSTDRTKAIIRELQAEGRYRPEIFLHEPAWEEIRPRKAPNGEDDEARLDPYIEEHRLIDFARTRNYSTRAAIERGADWILWADGDEFFRGAVNIRRYVNGPFFPALVIRQINVRLENLTEHDIETPYRLFRPGRGLEFRGVVHEQPCFDVNANAEPALHLPDVDIIHFGYMDARVTRRKCVERNMTLVAKDRYVYPARLLGKLNVLRDFIHIAAFELEETQGRFTPRAIDFLQRAVALYHESFGANTRHVYYSYATRFYQEALELLARAGEEAIPGCGIPIETQLQVVAAPGGIPRGAEIPAPKRCWFASRDEFERIVLRDSGAIFEEFGGPYARRQDARPAARANEGGAVHEVHPVLADAREAGVLRGAGGEVDGGSAVALLPDGDPQAGRAAAGE